MFRKLLTLSLSAACLLGANAEEVCFDGLTYNCEGSEATLVSSGNRYGTLVVPNTIPTANGYANVVAVAENAFKGGSYINGFRVHPIDRIDLSLCQNLQTIGEEAFSACDRMFSLDLGTFHGVMAGDALEGCSRLQNLYIRGNRPPEADIAGDSRIFAQACLWIPQKHQASYDKYPWKWFRTVKSIENGSALSWHTIGFTVQVNPWSFGDSQIDLKAYDADGLMLNAPDKVSVQQGRLVVDCDKPGSVTVTDISGIRYPVSSEMCLQPGIYIVTVDGATKKIKL